MKRLAVLPLLLSVFFVSCTEENTVTSNNPTDSLKTVQSLVILSPTTAKSCTTTVSMFKNIAVSFASAKPIASTSFSIGVFDSLGKTAIPSSELFATVSPFTSTTAGSATITLAPGSTAKKANYLIRIIASEGKSSDTLEHFLYIKDGITGGTPTDMARKGILRNTVSLYNTNGSKASGLNATKNDSVGITAILTYGSDSDYGYITGTDYGSNSVIDFKTFINIERHRAATKTWITKLSSLNGTLYKAISTAEYEKTALRDLKKVADAATETEIALPLLKDSCFVAKLGGSRGYALAKIKKFEKDYEGASNTGNNGIVTFEYFQIPADSLK